MGSILDWFLAISLITCEFIIEENKKKLLFKKMVVKKKGTPGPKQPLL